MLIAIFHSFPFLLKGLFVTIEVALIVVSSSLVLGVTLGAGVTYGPPPIRIAVRLFSDVIRGIPILVLIFFVYYGVPVTGLKVNSFAAGVSALVLFSTVDVAFGLRMLARLARRSSIWWILGSAAWGGLSTALLAFLVRS